MAAYIVPSLASLSHITDYSHTITPFWASFLKNLPLLNPTSPAFSPLTFYHTTNPLLSAFLITQGLAVFTFLLSSITGNLSQVDRLWSLLPAIYVAHFTYFAHYLSLPTARLDTLLVLVILWSVRLTFNYFRKGGYSPGSEDYRWSHVRKMLPSSWAKVLVNLVLISWFQNVLLLLITLPAYFFLFISALPEAAVPNGFNGGDINAFGTVDLIFSRALILALIAGFFADQQQWNYQKARKAFEESGKQMVPEGWQREDLERGFCVTGLWSFSRHPNFLAEQAFWVMAYQWSCFLTDTIYNYACLGPLFYCAIFQASTFLTEKISASKYPEYTEYQRLVGRFMPKLSAFWESSNPQDEEEEEEEEVKKRQ
ncbi:hypothetical protein EV426DRAFT_307986 [Tirmania nivea]|nr:hypothetical protein EV426DRAFT_307986 [Tirmania nivea]